MAVKLSSLIKRAQVVVNLYVRHRDCPDGWCSCISCGEAKQFEEMDAGHFIPTTTSALRFDLRNVHAQCRKCNRFEHGNLALYTRGLEKKLGAEVVDELLSRKGESRKWTRPELEEIIAKYNA